MRQPDIGPYVEDLQGLKSAMLDEADRPSFREVFLSWHEETGTVEVHGPGSPRISKFQARWPDFCTRLRAAYMISHGALKAEWIKIAKECKP